MHHRLVRRRRRGTSAMDSAVLFIVFNRPEVTARVFAEIRRARPPRLYVAADGPRSDRPDDVENCRRTRAIIDGVDWPCELHTRFQNENIGCRKAVSGAIDWFFMNEECGIVLEDDCLPEPTFFNFCEQMLVRYQDDARVGHITGTAFFDATSLRDIDSDYVFSHHITVWGWASWRRAWRDFDLDLAAWNSFPRERLLPSMYPWAPERTVRANDNARAQAGSANAWDYQWSFTNRSQSRLAVVPRRNQIVNIGFGDGATHTRFRAWYTPRRSSPLPDSLRHPPFVVADHRYDRTLSTCLYPPLAIAKPLSLMKKIYKLLARP